MEIIPCMLRFHCLLAPLESADNSIVIQFVPEVHGIAVMAHERIGRYTVEVIVLAAFLILTTDRGTALLAHAAFHETATLNSCCNIHQATVVCT